MPSPMPPASNIEGSNALAQDARTGGVAPANPPPPLDLSGLERWIVDQGLRGVSLEDLVDGFCRRVIEAGFPARRFNMIIGTLHPRHGARSYIWRPTGLETDAFPRRRTEEDSAAYLRSPIYYLRKSGEARMRRRLDTDGPLQFVLLEELRDAGMTEYAARLVRFGEVDLAALKSGPSVTDPRFDPLQGIFFSCATDVPGGFDDGQLEQVARILPCLALAVKSRSTFDVARTLLETYIGADAGRHVLIGEIDRHSVQTIRAVIWFCDLRGFSLVANRVAQQELVEILDAYLEAMARPVLDHQGQILKFMGDGFLATFDLAARDSQSVCRDALEAAAKLVEFFPRFNAERREAGKRTLDFGVALHLGDVLYGNIGAAERLDFTVVGSAVNEASRIEGMCRTLQRKLLVSQSFREVAATAGDRMISLGFHALRGIREPQELFTLAEA
jgi:adenylate cyclase